MYVYALFYLYRTKMTFPPKNLFLLKLKIYDLKIQDILLMASSTSEQISLGFSSAENVTKDINKL